MEFGLREDIGKLIDSVAATASQAGLTLEETACMTMILKDCNNDEPRQWLRASTIGTELRQVLSKLTCAECNGMEEK